MGVAMIKEDIGERNHRMSKSSLALKYVILKKN